MNRCLAVDRSGRRCAMELNHFGGHRLSGPYASLDRRMLELMREMRVWLPPNGKNAGAGSLRREAEELIREVEGAMS